MIQDEVTDAADDAIEAAELDEGPEPTPVDLEAAQAAETRELVAEEAEPRELEETPSLAETIGDTVAATVADDDDVWEEVDEPPEPATRLATSFPRPTRAPSRTTGGGHRRGRRGLRDALRAGACARVRRRLRRPNRTSGGRHRGDARG